jgi:tetratricopeptide (TPR) repeat protein
MLRRMLRQDRSPEHQLARPVPECFRLAGGLIKRVLANLDAPPGDAERATALIDGIDPVLDDPLDYETLDDTVERCVDALTADPQCAPAMLLAGRALTLYGYVDEWHWHPRPLRDARRILARARELMPDDERALEAELLCELYARRFEQAGDLLSAIKNKPQLAFLHAYCRGVWFALHDNWALAEEWFGAACRATQETERRSWALVHLAEALARLNMLPQADVRMAEGVLSARPHRRRLHLWSKLKHARGRYDEAWELNRRSLTFGQFEPGQLWRQELLVYFRRLGFVPKSGFSLPEEQKLGIDGPFRMAGSDKADTGDIDDHQDDDEEFVPLFRANLFLEGEHLPVVSEIADPAASFEGRARLGVRVLEPRTFEKRPLQPGERFKPGQYIMTDEQAGTVFHVLLMKRHNLHNPYLDLPEDARTVFDFDRASLQRFENAPWDARLMLADHGFDPLRGALAACKLVDAFLRFAGGVGVDLETGMAIRAGEWRNEGPQGFDIRKHVVVRAAETAKGRYWVRTYGLCKFRRPELEIRELPHELVEGARSLLMDAAELAANGALYREGEFVGSPRQPMMLAAGQQATEDGASREVLELVDWLPTREPALHGATRGIQAMLHLSR